MIKTICTVVALAAATSLPSLALAQATAANTLEAMKAAADQTFDAADFDQSGVLSAREMERAAQDLGAAGQSLARADANRDGRVTRAEYHASFEAIFARLDADGDGVISAAERAQFRGMDIGTGMLGGGAPTMPTGD
jgi:hypothetical protein